MAYSETFERYCTTSGPSYSYTANNCMTRAHYNYANNEYTYYYTNGSSSGYNNHSDSGYNNHTNTAYADYHELGCADHTDSGYDDKGYSNHSDYGYDNHSCSQYREYDDSSSSSCVVTVCSEYGCSDHNDKGSYSDSGCRDHTDSGYDNHYDTGGYSDHSNSGYNNHSNSGCSDHTDTACYQQQTGYSCSTVSCIEAGYANSCSVTWTYTNYADAGNSNKGASYSFTWNQPALKVTSGVSRISDPKQYSAVLTELKEKINHLAANKGRNKVTPNSTTTTGSALTGTYNGLRATLNALYTDLKQTSTTATDSIKYQRISGNKISDLKNQIDSLSASVITYTNYVNSSYSDTGSPCQDGSTNSSYISPSIVTYKDSGSSQHPSTSTASGTSHARYVDYSTYLDNPKTP